MNLTTESTKLFETLAKDACNWGGYPLLGGNFTFTKEMRGNLTQLKRAGLLSTWKERGEEWVQFSAEGKAHAAELGIDLGIVSY